MNATATPVSNATHGPVLELDEVYRGYARGVDVLAGVSLTVDRGSVVGLVGKNGSGKTTLMRLAIGLMAPRRGRVRLFGLDPRRQPEAVKRRVGYVAEDQILPPFLRVAEVLALHRSLFPDWDDAMAADLLRRFALPAAARIKTLSKGQARQVALACAVAHRPELLLLDEPAGGLDPAARREFLETSIRLLNEAGSAILFSSHYMTDVERMADRIVMLHDRRVLLDSPADELKERFSLVLLPAADDAGAENGGGGEATVALSERLLELDGCLGVRRRGELLHAVFHLDPDEAEGRLAAELGIGGIHATALALEEMFVELAGSGR